MAENFNIIFNHLKVLVTIPSCNHFCTNVVQNELLHYNFFLNSCLNYEAIISYIV